MTENRKVMLEMDNFNQTHDGIEFACPSCNRSYLLGRLLDGHVCECGDWLGPVYVEHEADLEEGDA